MDQDADSSLGGETPPSGPSGRPAWFRRHLLQIVVAGAAVLALGAVIAAVALFLGASTRSIDTMVPASAHLYAVVYLDPPMAQKVNLLNLSRKLPDLQHRDINKRIDDALNRGWRDSGLSYDNDIRPWLGSRLAIVARAADDPGLVLLAESKDDARARAALAKFRGSVRGRSYSWKDATYEGVTISVGIPLHRSSTSNDVVYAYLDHTVVFGDSDAFVRAVIDADHGKAPRLRDSATYKAMVSRLPSERLVLLYVAGGPADDRLKLKVSGTNWHGVPIPEDSAKLDAFTSLGFVLVARPNGLTADLEVKLDPAKLDSTTRASLRQRSHRNASLDWVPSRSFLLFATIASSQDLQRAVAQASASTPAIKEVLDRLGLTGQNGALAHLTGDEGVEVDQAAAGPAAALLLGTDDRASLQSFLDRFFLYGLQLSFQTKCPLSSRGPVTCTFVPSASSASTPRATLRKENYHGVEITSAVATPPAPSGISPAYAIAGGMGIVASSVEEVRAVIDAHQTGQTIALAGHYRVASQDLNSSPDTVFYLDIGAAARSIRPLLPPSIRREFDARVAPDLAPLQAFIVTVEKASDSLSERIFLVID